MNIAPREKALAAMTIVVLLFGLLGLTARKRIEKWRELRSQYSANSLKLSQHRLLLKTGRNGKNVMRSSKI